MTPHDEHYPRGPDGPNGSDSGTIPFLLGVAAIVLVGMLVLTISI